MGEGANGVEPPPAASTGAVPPSASPDVDNARTQDPDNNANETGPAASTSLTLTNQEAEAARKAHGAGGTETRAEEKPTPGEIAPRLAATPERDVAPAPPTARVAEAEPDVETKAGAGLGCATPPPSAHESEGSDTQSADGQGSPLHGQKPSRQAGGSGTASKSRLLAFRSFSRDKKQANKPGGADGAASPERRSKAAGEGEDGGAEHEERGKERRKRFWK